MQVLVIGRLGELAKKIYELEVLIEYDPENAVAILELSAYNSVLNVWPLLENVDLDLLLVDFKLACSRLVSANKDFEEAISSDNHLRLQMDSQAYLACKATVHSKLKHLNALGRFVGNVPILTVEL